MSSAKKVWRTERSPSIAAAVACCRTREKEEGIKCGWAAKSPFIPKNASLRVDALWCEACERRSAKFWCR